MRYRKLKPMSIKQINMMMADMNGVPYHLEQEGDEIVLVKNEDKKEE